MIVQFKFGATKREPEVKTTTTTTTTTKTAVVHLEKAQKDGAEPFPRIEAESKKPNLFLKAELTAGRTPAKEPIL